MNIVNVGYRSTNYYAIDFRGGKLLVDCGWPGSLPEMLAQLKRKGIALGEIKFLLVTHFHPDHAGLTQELKQLGVKHILLDLQTDFVAAMNEWFKANSYPFTPIDLQDSQIITCAGSRALLESLGLYGQILHTPGHSDDSISLLLDEGMVFSGDLQPRFTLSETDSLSAASWDKIYQHKITRIFPAHGAA